jgi:hypothetical protein
MMKLLWLPALLLAAACADIPPGSSDSAEGHSCAGPSDADLDSSPTVLKRSSFACARSSDTGFDRGTPFAIEVVHVDGKPVEVDTANAYWNMQRAAAADGIDLRVISGFRTQSEQTYLYGCYTNCNCNNCNLAAYPGYSNHQSGQALDLNSHGHGVRWWLRTNAAAFGFYETVPGEDWHWEYLGDGPVGGICGEGGGAVSLQLTDRGSYENGFWIKSTGGDATHHVRYRVGRHDLGASEHRAGGFPVYYVFSDLGWRDITAEAYDKNNRKLGEHTVRVQVTARARPRAQMQFAGAFHDQGHYTNNFWVKVDADPTVVRVRYYAGVWQVGSSVDQAGGFAARLRFNELGWRTIEAVGYDAQGRIVRQIGATVKLTP